MKVLYRPLGLVRVQHVNQGRSVVLVARGHQLETHYLATVPKDLPYEGLGGLLRQACNKEAARRLFRISPAGGPQLIGVLDHKRLCHAVRDGPVEAVNNFPRLLHILHLHQSRAVRRQLATQDVAMRCNQLSESVLSDVCVQRRDVEPARRHLTLGSTLNRPIRNISAVRLGDAPGTERRVRGVAESPEALCGPVPPCLSFPLRFEGHIQACLQPLAIPEHASVHKHVRPAAIRHDEAVALAFIPQLDPAGHDDTRRELSDPARCRRSSSWGVIRVVAQSGLHGPREHDHSLAVVALLAFCLSFPVALGPAVPFRR
mmetsp:Transcript_727/g.2297  ORF Transcript_727/g.2297 Transcript_727/m.2297 type:complete len:316 (-) Transcript_727:948-1895(-)